MKAKSWTNLKKGDLVDVIAPGYFCSMEDIEKGVRFLESLGLKARVPKDICGHHFLHSNEDSVRQRHLIQALESSDSQAIWCARGGYGSNRLTTALEKLPIPKKAKLFIGLSDITTLHLFLNQHWGWKTIHGPLLDRCGNQKLSSKQLSELKKVLFQKPYQAKMKMKPLNALAEKSAVHKGSLIGGNMTVLTGHVGTSLAPQLKGSFLFLEDWGERGYRLDRMLEQIKQAGLLKGCKGILLGHFLGGAEPQTGQNNFDLVFQRWAQELNVPLWSGVDAGHGDSQRTLPLNSPCEIISSKKSATLYLNY